MYTFNDKKLYLYIKVLSSCGEIVFGESADLFLENEIKHIFFTLSKIKLQKNRIFKSPAQIAWHTKARDVKHERSELFIL